VFTVKVIRHLKKESGLTTEHDSRCVWSTRSAGKLHWEYGGTFLGQTFRLLQTKLVICSSVRRTRRRLNTDEIRRLPCDCKVDFHRQLTEHRRRPPFSQRFPPSWLSAPHNPDDRCLRPIVDRKLHRSPFRHTHTHGPGKGNKQPLTSQGHGRVSKIKRDGRLRGENARHRWQSGRGIYPYLVWSSRRTCHQTSSIPSYNFLRSVHDRRK